MLFLKPAHPTAPLLRLRIVALFNEFSFKKVLLELFIFRHGILLQVRYLNKAPSNLYQNFNIKSA